MYTYAVFGLDYAQKFQSWNAAVQAVSDCKNRDRVVRKFWRERDADAFLSGGPQANEEPEGDGSVYFTSVNGTEGVVAIGIFYGRDSLQNTSAVLEGYHTRQSACLAAGILAMQESSGLPVALVTDTKYVVTSNRKQIINRNGRNANLIQRFKAMLADSKSTVTHIPGDGNVPQLSCARNLAAQALERMSRNESKSAPCQLLEANSDQKSQSAVVEMVI